MNKGTMMAGIMDAVAFNGALFLRVYQRNKAEGLFTPKEMDYITQRFNQFSKEGTQCLEQLKELVTSKGTEVDKMQVLGIIHADIKRKKGLLLRFEKGFERLSLERKRRRENTAEVEALFKTKKNEKDMDGAG